MHTHTHRYIDTLHIYIIYVCICTCMKVYIDKPDRQAGSQIDKPQDQPQPCESSSVSFRSYGLKPRNAILASAHLSQNGYVSVKQLYMRPVPKLYPKSSHASRVGITLCGSCESLG